MRPAAPTRRGEDGATTVQYLLAVGLSLLFVVAMANVVVAQYARGVARLAVDEGTRAGARLHATDGGAVSACEAAGAAAFADLLSGSGGAGAAVTCRVDATAIRATATLRFPAWLPLYPDFDLGAAAVAVREVAPA